MRCQQSRLKKFERPGLQLFGALSELRSFAIRDEESASAAGELRRSRYGALRRRLSHKNCMLMVDVVPSPSVGVSFDLFFANNDMEPFGFKYARKQETVDEKVENVILMEASEDEDFGSFQQEMEAAKMEKVINLESPMVDF
ncbi:hypothetical protein AVEN_264982-1 [Araneus ventricosus]|uniref:Uncharacterized protein n=1 Tax=Araneus ventricosus TaxID=182803 RepID=A0A4Y2ENT7_ARAVE|nr:hypothetical protein AVEN_264982-1 [Araneus ventricosus]